MHPVGRRLSSPFVRCMLWSSGDALASVHDPSRVPQVQPAEHRASRFYQPSASNDRTQHHVKPLDGMEGEPPEKRSRGPNKSKATHLLNNDTLNAAMQGELRDHDGNLTPHKSCTHLLPDGSPCFFNLWSTKDSYKAHITRFMALTQEQRTCTVWAMLKDQYYCEQDAAGKPIGKSKWHYVVNTDQGRRCVCQHVFLLNYPISPSVVQRLQRRIHQGCTTPHAKHEENSDKANADRGASAADDIIGWYIAYAEFIGDYMPDSQEVIVPRRWRHDEWKEYFYSFGPDAVSYEYFCSILKNALELSHICRARKLLNFQHCTQCVDLNEAVAKAMRSNDTDQVKLAKAKRAAHHSQTRNERLVYYSRRERGRTFPDTLSLILDKWDSAKTTVPYFARSPGHWWSALKHNVLEQSVLGTCTTRTAHAPRTHRALCAAHRTHRRTPHTPPHAQ